MFNVKEEKFFNPTETSWRHFTITNLFEGPGALGAQMCQIRSRARRYAQWGICKLNAHDRNSPPRSELWLHDGVFRGVAVYTAMGAGIHIE